MTDPSESSERQSNSVAAAEFNVQQGLISEGDELRVFGRWTTAGAVVWGVLTVCVVVLFAPPLFRSFWGGHGRIMDYYQEWSSARSVILHQPVYQPTFDLAQRDFGVGRIKKDSWILGYNVHPPTSILFALPFAYLPYVKSFFVWSLFTLALFALSLWLVAKQSGFRFAWMDVLPIVSVCLLSGPFSHQFAQGQLNPLILFLVTLGWMETRARHPWRAGLWLGTAAAVKAFPAFIGIYFLVRREWKYLFTLIFGFVVATLVTVAVLGIDAYYDYVRLVLPEALEWRSANTNASLAGLWSKLFDPADRVGHHYIPLVRSPLLAKSLTALSWLAVMSLLIPVCARAKTVREVDHAFGLTLIAMLLLSPITWEHYFLILPLPLLTIWMRIPKNRLIQGVYLAILTGLAIPVFFLIYLYLPQSQTETGVSPLQTLGLPSICCYMLCGMFCIGSYVRLDVIQSKITESRSASYPAFEDTQNLQLGYS